MRSGATIAVPSYHCPASARMSAPPAPVRPCSCRLPSPCSGWMHHGRRIIVLGCLCYDSLPSGAEIVETPAAFRLVAPCPCFVPFLALSHFGFVSCPALSHSNPRPRMWRVCRAMVVVDTSCYRVDVFFSYFKVSPTCFSSCAWSWAFASSHAVLFLTLAALEI